MSIKIMTAVWDSTPYEGGKLLVLLAMADWADHDGKCWPSVSAIARKARLTDRQVYNILAEMRADGVITYVPGGGRGKISTYYINTAMIAAFSQPETLKSVTPKPCNLQQQNPEICDNPPDPLIGRTVREPSLEPPIQPTASETAPSSEIAPAAARVMLLCSFAGKPLQAVIHEAISIALKHPDCNFAPMAIAETMARRWGEYQQAAGAGLLRYQWGPEKFFAGGHWLLDAAWPYDQQLLRNRREAALGAR